MKSINQVSFYAIKSTCIEPTCKILAIPLIIFIFGFASLSLYLIKYCTKKQSLNKKYYLKYIYYWKQKANEGKGEGSFNLGSIKLDFMLYLTTNKTIFITIFS